MKRTWIFLGLALSAPMASCGTRNPIASAPPETTTLQGPSSANEVALAFDYPKFRSLAELAGRSEAVVLAKTVSVGPSAELVGPDGKGAGFPMTPATLVVESVLGGGGVEEGQTITILQTGGELSGKLYTVAEEPLLVSGSETMLFIESVRSPQVTHAVIGGGAGQFLVNDRGLIEPSFRETNPEFAEASKVLEGLTVSDAAALLAEEVGRARQIPDPQTGSTVAST